MDDFIMDIQAIRDRAREEMAEGALIADYEGGVDTAVRILNEALATELVCVLRYKFHAVTAQGIDSDSVRQEFAQHAAEETAHADMIAERITQLGGKPDFNPASLARRSHSEYVEGRELIDMIRENLVAERIAIASYGEMIRYFQDRDPTTRRMLEEILAKEEEHATEMHDLLVAQKGRPMLSH